MTDLRSKLGMLGSLSGLGRGCVPGLVSAALAVGGVCGVALGQDAMGDPPAKTVESSPAEGTSDDAEPKFEPRAVEIFETHIEALGGREAVFSVDKRTIRGTYEGAPLSFPGRLYMVLEAPDKMFWQISEPAGLSLTTVYNGERGWREIRQALQEPRLDWIVGPTLTDLVESASFYGEADYEARYKELTLAGTADFYGTTCFVIRGVRNSGKMHLLMFDQDTGLYKGARTAVLHQSGEMRAMDVRIGEWQVVDGVKVPKTMIQQFRGEPASNIFKMGRVTHETDDSIEWSPPGQLPPFPELGENNLPVPQTAGEDADG